MLGKNSHTDFRHHLIMSDVGKSLQSAVDLSAHLHAVEDLDDIQRNEGASMSVSSRVQSRLLTGQRFCSLRIVLSSLLLVGALSVLGCPGSNGNDDEFSDIGDETITGGILEVTLPPDFDPDEIDRIELLVTGPGVPADLPNISLDPLEVTIGDRTILALAISTPIPPGLAREFTLLAFLKRDTRIPNFLGQKTADLEEGTAFSTRDTRIPNFLGQETVDLEEGTLTKVVMTLFRAIARLDVQPPFVGIEVGDAQQFLAIGHLGADCSTNDITTCAIQLRSDLTSDANWTVTPPTGQPAIATISNEPANRGLAIGTIPGSAAVRATVDVLDGAATLNVRPDTDTPSVFVAIGGLAVSEGDEGAQEMDVTVKLSMPLDDTVSVDFTTADLEATAADQDYMPTTGTLTFAPGETEQSIRVAINGDSKVEADESFRLVLSNPQPEAVQLLFSEVTITIVNDDPPPTDPPSVFVAIGGLAVSEGDEGAQEMDVTVKLSMPLDDTVSVDFTTADLEATAADQDYMPTTGTLTFAPGETEQSIRVAINGDSKVEADESFRLVLSNPQPEAVQLLFSEVTITIVNDDATGPPVPEVCTDPVAECTGNHTPVLVDGTCSFDPEGQPLTYLWSVSPTCSLDDPTAPKPTASCDFGEHPVELVVTASDGRRSEPAASGILVVQDTLGPVVDCNALPETVELSERDISFQATAYDQCVGDDVEVTITQFDCIKSTEATEGTENQPVSCLDSVSVKDDTITLFAPSESQEVTWTVFAEDVHGNTTEKQCRVKVLPTPSPPMAQICPTLLCIDDQPAVILDGTCSSPDPEDLSYFWSVPPACSLDDPTAPKPTTFCSPGSHEVKLEVTDADGLRSEVVETIDMLEPCPVPCRSFKKQVSTDDGHSWFDADAPVSAPTQVVGAGAQYRFVVRNCSETKQCEDTVITDHTLDIVDVRVPGSTGAGLLLPRERVIVTQDKPGFANLDQPQLCYTPGAKRNRARMVTVVEGSGTVARYTGKAIVICQEEPQ